MPKGVDATRISRLSVGWVDSADTLGDKFPSDTDRIMSTIDCYVTSDLSAANAQVDSGATFSGGASIGGGTNVVQISTATFSVDFGSVAAHDSSTVTIGLSSATRGDTIIATPDSEWSGAYYDLSVTANSGDTTGEVTLAAVNSTLTAVNPDAVVFRVTRINFSDFI